MHPSFFCEVIGYNHLFGCDPFLIIKIAFIWLQRAAQSRRGERRHSSLCLRRPAERCACQLERRYVLFRVSARPLSLLLTTCRRSRGSFSWHALLS